MAQAKLFPMLVLLSLGFNLVLVQSTFFNVDVTYEIEMDVFSGRDDPSWIVDKRHPKYDEIASAVNNGPPTDMGGNLGYTGFMVKARNAFGQSAWKTVGRHTNRKLESLLLSSCPTMTRQGPGSTANDDDISISVINHVRQGIYGQLPVTKHVKEIKTEYEDGSLSELTVRHTIFRQKRQAAGVCSTVFTPSNWNYSPVQRRNNCYNYASNLQTNTFAQPGRASGRRFRYNEANEVYEACIRDGFERLSGPNPGSNCLMILVIWPGEDYHFYRQDADGTWSHKSGQTRARNTDESGNRILDPLTADRGPYSVVAGYLGVTPNANIN